MTEPNANTNPNVYNASGNIPTTSTRQLLNTYGFRLAPGSWCGWYDNINFSDYLVIVNGSDQTVNTVISGENGEPLAREICNSGQSRSFRFAYVGAYFVHVESGGLVSGTGEIVVMTRTLIG